MPNAPPPRRRRGGGVEDQKEEAFSDGLEWQPQFGAGAHCGGDAYVVFVATDR